MPAVSASTISIHAPLTGSDPDLGKTGYFSGHFNPRSPYGERPCIPYAPGDPDGISIHAPLTGSDLEPGGRKEERNISIHAPLTGSDPHVEMGVRGNWDFNPRSPYGERLPYPTTFPINQDFNPRSPYGERLSMTWL